MKLYVGNPALQTTEEDLNTLFTQAGTIDSANVVADWDSGFSHGFGFVEMSSNEEGQSAITMFNGKDVDGRSLKVNEARSRD